MTNLEFHPVCLAFPEYPPDVYAARKADYAAHPERAGDTAVILAEDDDGGWKIADGRHHHRICQELGRECEYLRFTGSRAELVAFVESRNAHRRHCEPSQIAASLVMLHEWATGGDRKSESFRTARAVLTTQAEAAEAAGVSSDTVGRAAKVKRIAPELLPAMRDGKLDAYTAAKVADLPAVDRAEVAAADDPKAAAKEKLAERNGKPAEPEPESGYDGDDDPFEPADPDQPAAGLPYVPRDHTRPRKREPFRPDAETLVGQLLLSLTESARLFGRFVNSPDGEKFRQHVATLQGDPSFRVGLKLIEHNRKHVNGRTIRNRWIGFRGVRYLLRLAAADKTTSKSVLRTGFLEALDAAEPDGGDE